MPRLEPGELLVPIGPLGGQEGRVAPTQIGIGKAIQADGTFHDSRSLRRCTGSAKLVSSPIPASCYELDGIRTGILEVPCKTGFETAWNVTLGTGTFSFAVNWGMKFLGAGEVSDNATTDGQIIFSTSEHLGAHPAGGADQNGIRLGLVIASGKYTIRMKWGASTLDIPLESGGTPFDINKWISFTLRAYHLNGVNAFVRLTAGQESLGVTSGNEIAAAKNWIAHQLRFGGEIPARRPQFGILNSCHCLISEVIVGVSTNSQIIYGTNGGTTWSRATATSDTATLNQDIWPLKDGTLTPTSLLGVEAKLVGNRVSRDEGITATMEDSLRFDGAGGLLLPGASRFREAPKTNNGLQNFLLEHPQYTFGFWFKPRKNPFGMKGVVNRATLLNFSTPYAPDLGVSGGPGGTRPSEHLRAEIALVGTDYYLRVYFGELDTTSLKHPVGTPGGNTSTSTWPPPSSSGAEPPCTWNKVVGDPTAAHGAANGKSAFQILLGAEADNPHPMTYAWVVFIQRKFTALSDPLNAASVFVYRVKADGTLDTVHGEKKDTNADANGERHPAAQSCYSTSRLNGTQINYSAHAYVMSLGAACGSKFGDELLSWDGVTKSAHMEPKDGDGQPFVATDQCESWPFVGNIGSPFFLTKYLTAKDRLMIATAGRFGTEQRTAFQKFVIESMLFNEGAGNVLRSSRGKDVTYFDRVVVTRVDNNTEIATPPFVAAFPRPEPLSFGEASMFVGEYSSITGIVQRLRGDDEEVYVTAQPGLYLYSRSGHSLSRVSSIPGQGGPARSSFAIDGQQRIHIAGGAGRPVIITADGYVATSGIDPPIYWAPFNLITAKTSSPGSIGVDFQYSWSTSLNALIGTEIPSGSQVSIAVGYWSEGLKMRSSPGEPFTVRYEVTPPPAPYSSTLTTFRYRVLLSNLPLPSGPNAKYVTHWEIYRTTSNNGEMFLESRIPIGTEPGQALAGIRYDESLTIPVQFFSGLPPEGCKSISVFGRRMFFIAPPENDRSIMYSVLDAPNNVPPLYELSLEQTQSPATAVVVRRDRAFAFTTDYAYQLRDSYQDTDDNGIVAQPVQQDPLTPGTGCLSGFSWADDNENGIYVAGRRSIVLTEGGTYDSVSKLNDSSDVSSSPGFSWPDSWDISRADEFTSWSDERLKCVGFVGPSADDPNRFDAVMIFYENSLLLQDGRTKVQPEMSRVKGIDIRCSAAVTNPATGKREVWFGNDLGYICKTGEGTSQMVDYEWLDPLPQLSGQVLYSSSTTVVRLEASTVGYPDTDVFRGALLRIYRAGVLISTRRVTSSDASHSWVDVTVDGAHGSQAGDFWSIGAIPMRWISGDIDFGVAIQDKQVRSAELRLD